MCIVTVSCGANLAVLQKLKSMSRRLARIEAALQREENMMSEIDDALTSLAAQVGELAVDLDRELADLLEALSGNLTPEQEAAFASITDKVAAMKAAIDAADPVPAPEPAPEG